ncbi:MAG TPA: hypothetical protein VMD74_01310 [Candidatus Methylomirabilis sp.]|nr:hypothetical protein [Candidatus Methylomirabilis sp.]
MNKIFFLIALSIFLSLSALFAQSINAENLTPPATKPPIISEIQDIIGVAHDRLIVSGLVSPDNTVLVYLNGTYNSVANISEGNNLFNKFSDSIELDHNKANIREIYAIARDNENFIMSAPTIGHINTFIDTTTISTPTYTAFINQTTSSVNSEIQSIPINQKREILSSASKFASSGTATLANQTNSTSPKSISSNKVAKNENDLRGQVIGETSNNPLNVFIFIFFFGLIIIWMIFVNKELRDEGESDLQNKPLNK